MWCQEYKFFFGVLTCPVFKFLKFFVLGKAVDAGDDADHKGGECNNNGEFHVYDSGLW